MKMDAVDNNNEKEEANVTNSQGSQGSGSGSQPQSLPQNIPKKPAYGSYKLLVDPALVKGANKLYRFDGHVPDDPTYPSVQLRDPRNSSKNKLARHWDKVEKIELPMPKFKVN